MGTVRLLILFCGCVFVGGSFGFGWHVLVFYLYGVFACGVVGYVVLLRLCGVMIE